MKSIFPFIILLFITLNNTCFSQSNEATIFFKDGDSIQGYGLLKNNKIKFKVSPDGKYDSWGPEMINKIEFDHFFENSVYEYIQLNKLDNPVLMECISYGEVSLYRQKKRNG